MEIDMPRHRCELCGRKAVAVMRRPGRKRSRAGRAGVPVAIPGHTLCPGCFRRAADSFTGGGAGMPRDKIKVPAGQGGTVLAGLLAAYCRDKGYPDPAPEHVFHPARLWRFDFAWPAERVALEVEGVTAGGGRHQRVKGYEGDCEKYSEAQLLGWVVLRATPRMIGRGEHLPWLDRALARKWAA